MFCVKLDEDDRTFVKSAKDDIDQSDEVLSRSKLKSDR
jgi:hypothetical protein